MNLKIQIVFLLSFFSIPQVCFASLKELNEEKIENNKNIYAENFGTVMEKVFDGALTPEQARKELGNPIGNNIVLNEILMCERGHIDNVNENVSEGLLELCKLKNKIVNEEKVPDYKRTSPRLRKKGKNSYNRLKNKIDRLEVQLLRDISEIALHFEQRDYEKKIASFATKVTGKCYRLLKEKKEPKRLKKTKGKMKKRILK